MQFHDILGGVNSCSRHTSVTCIYPCLQSNCSIGGVPDEQARGSSCPNHACMSGRHRRFAKAAPELMSLVGQPSQATAVYCLVFPHGCCTICNAAEGTFSIKSDCCCRAACTLFCCRLEGAKGVTCCVVGSWRSRYTRPRKDNLSLLRALY